MKIRKAFAAVLVLLIVNTPGVSQAAGMYVRAHTSTQFGQAQPDQPPSIVKVAPAAHSGPDLRQDHRECIEALENVNKEADRLLGPATRWPFYPDIKLQQVQELEANLASLLRKHHSFAVEAKDKPGIAKNLRKIEKLRSEIGRKMAQIVSELQQRKSHRLLVHEQMRDINTALTRWHNECRKIGKAIQAT